MPLSDLYTDQRVIISCELFPPKTDKGVKNLLRNVERLKAFSPDFFTCTYGAGGSSQNRTLEILEKIKSQFQIPVASHLTLVDSTVDDLREYLHRAARIDVDYIVALRGVPPKGSDRFEPCENGLRYANELVDLISVEFNNFGVAVAGYPEVHQEAPSADVDLENLKRKVEAGADIVITQLFFDNADFLQFRDRCRAVDIQVPIVPGIMPVTDFKQIDRIASLCGAKLPNSFVEKLEQCDSPEQQFQVGVEHAIGQIANLIDEGVEGIHFYVLNKSDATSAILKAAEITSRLPAQTDG